MSDWFDELWAEHLHHVLGDVGKLSDYPCQRCGDVVDVWMASRLPGWEASRDPGLHVCWSCYDRILDRRLRLAQAEMVAWLLALGLFVVVPFLLATPTWTKVVHGIACVIGLWWGAPRRPQVP